MDDFTEVSHQIMSEFVRIGLDFGALPDMSFELSSATEMLERLKALPVGATFRDVFPYLPAHWNMEDPTTWTLPDAPADPAH